MTALRRDYWPTGCSLLDQSYLDLLVAQDPFRSVCHPVDIVKHLLSAFLLCLSLAFVCVFCSGTFPIKRAVESHPKTPASQMGACVGRLHPPRSRGKTYASGNSERKAVPAASQKISGQDRLLLPYLCPSNTRPCGNLEEQNLLLVSCCIPTAQHCVSNCVKMNLFSSW